MLLLKRTALPLLVCLSAVYIHAGEFIISEKFDNLDSWLPQYFPKIKTYSIYTAAKSGNETYLKAESSASASGLIFKKAFNVYEYPIMKWRWKVDNLYKNTNPILKSGDDYPIRVYVVFKYDPEKARIWDKVLYNSAKLVYGRYPPQGSLNYVWASSGTKGTIINSPYTEKSRLIFLQAGPENAGMWITEEVNILEDYRKIFGKEPPEDASIAIMNDSDNTGESSVSYLSDLVVYK